MVPEEGRKHHRADPAPSAVGAPWDEGPLSLLWAHFCSQLVLLGCAFARPRMPPPRLAPLRVRPALPERVQSPHPLSICQNTRRCRCDRIR